jgi:DNA-binding transcriptional regulator LsrR (DeoR family)
VSRKERFVADIASHTSAGAGEAAVAETPEAAESTSQREMMRLVAQLYYVRELGQPEIAALTGFSISKVSRLLATARAAGVVRISVEGTPASPTPLARALSEALGLEEIGRAHV